MEDARPDGGQERTTAGLGDADARSLRHLVWMFFFVVLFKEDFVYSPYFARYSVLPCVMYTHIFIF